MEVLVFGVLYWAVAVLLAGLFGLGWFFLLGTARRLFLAFPASRIWILERVSGEERAERERELLRQPLSRFSYIMHAVVVLVWIALTIIVFMKANVRVADFL